MEVETEDRPISRREARKQDRRDAIVTAARVSFLNDGYAATSMSGLLKTLGGSKATLWNYFRSKEELFAAVIEDVTIGFREALIGELNTDAEPQVALFAFYRRFVEKITNPDAIATWRLVVAESGRFPEVGRIFYERAARHVEQALATYIAHQIELGRLRDEDPVKMAQLLISMGASQQNKLLWGVAKYPVADRQANAARFADYFMRLFGVDDTGPHA